MGVDCSMQDAFSRTADIETPVRGDAGLIFWRDAMGDLRLIELIATFGLGGCAVGEIQQAETADHRKGKSSERTHHVHCLFPLV
ncbi:MAG: hypothetical protein EBW84_02770 [Betaproteobacteria bacterium]|nr:hypothetical protein [Betaproteobacteria bacterium]